MDFVYNDGGREAAGFRGKKCNDCAVRAIAIVGEFDYRQVYDDLESIVNELRKKQERPQTKIANSRRGVPKKVCKKYINDLGWTWTPTMHIGSGCKVHLRADELPEGRLVVSTSRHLVAVIDGQIHDTHDPSRGGTRCVYGYYRPPSEDTDDTTARYHQEVAAMRAAAAADRRRGYERTPY
jgi:hypothetical protein